jgi:hypothetical protein
LLARLKSAGDPDGATLDAGDSFMLQSYYREVSESDIRRQLGSGFSEAVMQLAPGRWHGPVLSGYGVHLVYVYERREAPSPLFDNVRQYVLQNWQREQQELFNVGSSMARRIRKSKRDPMPGKSPRHDTRRVQTWAEVGCVRPARPVHQPDCRFGR